jgi:hypothetical protein
MVDMSDIRALYGELQGILAQTPMTHGLSAPEIWNRYNHVVDLVSKATGTDYSRFAVQPETGVRLGSPYVVTTVFRQSCNGLIMNLHGKYFSDDQQPFSGPPPSVAFLK